jgi:hypothetical protein
MEGVTTMPSEEGCENEAALGERIMAAMEQDLAPYWAHLEESFERTGNMLDAARELEDWPTDVASDILRSTVVLGHAYLEDFLRTIAAAIIPNRGEERLNQIPLIGLANSGRAEKFLLGKLAQHKGKTVDQIIDQSVRPI